MLRDTTERPEGIEAGTLKLAGTNENTIYDMIRELLTNKEIYEKIQQTLDKQGKEKSKEDLIYFDEEYLKKYPEEKFEYTYREDIQQIFKDAIKALKIAEIYAQRIDWYLSGDDDEESFTERLNEELKDV